MFIKLFFLMGTIGWSSQCAWFQIYFLGTFGRCDVGKNWPLPTRSAFVVFVFFEWSLTDHNMCALNEELKEYQKGTSYKPHIKIYYSQMCLLCVTLHLQGHLSTLIESCEFFFPQFHFILFSQILFYMLIFGKWKLN